MDKRIEALTPWQQVAYRLMWSAGASKDKQAGAELDRMAAERPEEYEAAFETWKDIMYEVLY